MSSKGGDHRRRRGGRGGGGGYGSRSKRQPSEQQPQQDIDESSPVIQAFRGYQTELDTRHDKHERLVKLSRDITIESKRAIFLLQRITVSDAEKTLTEAETKFAEIRDTKWRAVSLELQNEDPFQFMRAYSAGLQEYVEAVSFWFYLKNDALVSCQYIQDELVFQPVENKEEEPAAESTDTNDAEPKDSTDPCTEDSSSNPTTPTNTATLPSISVAPPPSGPTRVHVPPIEYMLGIADLTGELMRLAISAVGKGQLDKPHKTCDFMRVIYDAFLSYGNVSRELSRKMSTLKQSLAKVENACYMLQVRGSEVPKHMLVDVISSAGGGEFGGEQDMMGE